MQDQWANRSQPIKEDMAFQRWSWRVQQLGWILLSFAILAALLGVFSNGWLSWTSTTAAEGKLRVDYQRVYRNGLAGWIDLAVSGEPGKAERTVVVSPELLELMTLESMQPDALRSESHPDGLHLLFAVAEQGTSRIRIGVLPHDAGGARGTVRLDDSGDAARIDFLILP